MVCQLVDMGALTTESNQASSSAATPTRDVCDLRVQTPTASDKVDPFGSTKFTSFSSPTSSPDSTLDDPFLEFDIEHDESTSTITARPTRTQQAQEASEHGNNASTDPQIPKPMPAPAVTDHYTNTPKSSPGPGYLFESPPTQVMERSNNSKYRIPSSVFARNKSTAPDWSMASNESLFSIHMGNMSFTDHYSYLRSGELGLSGEPSTSGQKLALPEEPSTSDQKLGGKATEVGKSQELGVVVESMKGVPVENAEDRKSTGDGRISHQSMESGSSTKSFVFPFLAGEKDKISSARIGTSAKLCPETPKSSNQESHTEEPQPSTEPAVPEPKTPPPAPAPVAPQNKWFSCFPCCS